MKARTLLHRYWIEFHLSKEDLPPYGIMLKGALVCGVTAYSYEDALELLRKHLFKDKPLPDVCKVVEDIDVSTLDEKHVQGNIGITVTRGIWFPPFPIEYRF